MSALRQPLKNKNPCTENLRSVKNYPTIQGPVHPDLDWFLYAGFYCNSKHVSFFFKVISVRNDCPLELLPKRPFVFEKMLSARRFRRKSTGMQRCTVFSFLLFFLFDNFTEIF